MTRSCVVLVLAGLSLALVACGGDGDGGKEPSLAGPTCGKAKSEMKGEPDLPPNFPTPEGVVYTSSRMAGPSSIVQGFRESKINESFDVYSEAFEPAGYDILDDEQELRDAEIYFSGDDTTGQVKLLEACEGRTSVTITVRPN